MLDPAVAEALVDRHARATLAASGAERFTRESIGPGPCVGRRGEVSDEVYAMVGSYQLLVDAPDQDAMIARVREAWEAAGHLVRSHRVFSSGGGELTANVPDDQVTITLTSGEPPAMLLLVTTACHQRP
jgi:hypothetical protein